MVRPTFYSCRCGQFCTLLKEEFVGGYVARPDPSAQVRTTVGRRLRVSLEIVTERGLVRQEWVTPIPVQSAADIARSAGRMLSQSRLMAPMTRLSIAVDEIGIPETHTANLFGVQSDAVAMGAVMGRAERRGGGGAAYWPRRSCPCFLSRRHYGAHDLQNIWRLPRSAE